MAKTGYQRLTRARARSAFAVAFMSRTSLWLGPDHLLVVDSGGFTETYKRFYFRDIQAIVVQKTTNATIVNIVLTILLVPTLTLGIASQTTGLKIFFLMWSGFFFFILLVNLLRGQSCRCFLRTAVQTEELPPLNRVRRARKVLGEIRPLIAAAQGGEPAPETISEMLRQQSGPAASATTAGADRPDKPPVIVS
jgi:hypothetical protein